MTPKTIQAVIDHFTRLPGIGPRQATRIAYALLKTPTAEVASFSRALLSLKERIRICPVCFAGFEQIDGEKTCAICANQKRIKTSICVVERESDIEPIERTGLFKGTYHVVGESIDVLERATPRTVTHLLNRIAYIQKQLPEEKRKSIEVILALNATVEGDALALYCEKILRPLHITITRLGKGLASGAELEYADQQTLINAMENRK